MVQCVAVCCCCSCVSLRVVRVSLSVCGRVLWCVCEGEREGMCVFGCVYVCACVCLCLSISLSPYL